jgi:pimeloyl-ACP methyl ester carboxylesterase
VLPFLDATYPTLPGARTVIGHSSGGFGALRLALDRPGLVRGVGALAADALFEGVHLSSLLPAVRRLQTAYGGSYDALWAARAAAGWTPPGEDAAALDQYLLAAAYSWPDLLARPGTGELDLRVWDRWLRHDPVRRVRDPAVAPALRALAHVHLGAGTRDEFHADVAARALHLELARRGVPTSLHLHDGGHAQAADLEHCYRHLLPGSL